MRPADPEAADSIRQLTAPVDGAPIDSIAQKKQVSMHQVTA